MTATSVRVPMAASQGNRWSPVIKIGLLGGGVAIYLALVGILTALANRMIITKVISLGQIILLSVFIIFGYMAAQRAAAGQAKRPIVRCLLSGAIAGLLISLFLSALVVIAPIINLRSVFINASPELFDLLTLGRGVPDGLLLLIGIGVAVGALSAGLFLLPDRLRRSVGMGLLAIPIVSILNSSLFAGRGISALQAAAVFVIALVITFFWQPARTATSQRLSALPTKQQRAVATLAYIILGIGVLLLPLLGPYPAEILDTVGLYILLGLGLNIVVGFAGLLDLGYVAFFALGAYTVGILTSPEIQWVGVQLTWWQALPFAVIVGTLAGVILGIPVLQMRGDYLAIVTLGFGEIIRLIFLSDWLKPLVGGSNGITRIPRALPVPAGSRLSDQQMLFYVILAGILVAAFIATRLKYSRLGRNWAAMREDEDVAQAMGINLVRTKLMAFATGAGLSALSGAIFASKLTSVYPHSFNLLVSINILAVIIVGGLGSIPGVIVGALVLVGLPELLREFAEYRLLVYGAVLVFMMLKRPEGLLPEARRKLELHEADEA
ncbi:MAG TPA: leucine/isoleucine/valine transporter permease subunit [Anaerolineae bacterium]|nr:leucine/isoleucine/valine transporter permease subunit [Anaerolineae bacterium]HNU02720.1 leucine/isoleucine/valine transporter permease subunit [Anaerolineae bacterium]